MVVKCWCSSVFGFTAQLGFFGEAVAVVFNLVIESLERLLHGGNAFLELVALLEEQSLAGADGAVALLEQSHIFDERLNLQTGRTHTFNKLDPAARGLVVIADAAFGARYRRDQADALVVAQCVRRDVELSARFCDGHGSHLPLPLV